MENKSFDILALGEVLLRLSPPNNERMVGSEIFQKQIGGAELNVVSQAALLGLQCGMISKLPANNLGTYAKNRVRFAGVKDDYLVEDESKDARLGLYFYENGAYPRKPGIVYDRRSTSIYTIDCNDFDEKMFEDARCFHTTGITLALSNGCKETAIDMIKKFKEKDTLISFDVNYRANLWTGEEARCCIEEILPLLDIFFCSEDTARLTFGKEGSVKEIMKSFADEYDIPVVATTRRIVHSPKVHTFGSIIYEKKTDTYYEEEPYRNIEVIDRIGSGDAYIAGVLYGLLSYDMDCQKALYYGNASGAVKNTIPGDMSSLQIKEMDAIIRDHHSNGRVSEMER
jgi:2-dehydro-3-deoxygluconokinase